MAHSYGLGFVTWRYQVWIAVGPDICHRGCAYTMFQTVQRHGVCSAAYGSVNYKEPLMPFEISVGHSPGFGLPSVAILSWLCRKWRKAIFTCTWHPSKWENSLFHRFFFITHVRWVITHVLNFDQLRQPTQRVKVQVYSLISSPRTYHPTLPPDHWTCSFVCHFNYTEGIQPLLRLDLIVRLVISALPHTISHRSEVKHFRIKCLAQGYKHRNNVPRLREEKNDISLKNSDSVWNYTAGSCNCEAPHTL